MSTQLKDLLSLATQPHKPLAISGLRGSSKALLSSILATTGNCCCIAPDENQAVILEEDLRLFTNIRILTYPGYEIPPYTPLSPDQRTTSARLSTLYQLLEPGVRFILILSAEALIRKVIPRKTLAESAELVMTGEDYAQDELITRLICRGYEQVSMVQTVGDFSVRGGIIDIYPPPFIHSENKIQDGPIRLDFFGDSVESLRAFDPISQRSQQELPEAVLLPVSDILFPSDTSKKDNQVVHSLSETAASLSWDSEKTAQLNEQISRSHRFAGIEFFLPLFYQDEKNALTTVLDYLPPGTRLISIDPEASRKTTELIHERILANFAISQHNQTPALLPSTLFLTPEQLQQELANFPQLYCSDFSEQRDNLFSISTTNHQLLKQDIEIQRKNRGLLAPLNDQIRSWQEQGDQVILCCRSYRHAKTLAELLEKHQQTIEFLSPPLNILELAVHNPTPDTLLICDHPLNEGFSLREQGLHLLSESELFGEMRLGNKGGKKTSRHKQGEPVRFAELRHSDVVVHRDHGLGIYHGLITMEIQGIKNDFMLIEYKDGDRLYLPVDRLNLISRYEGLSDKVPRIDKLGSQSWQSAKSKVKEEVWKIAQELLNIYAQREMRQGRRFSPPDELFLELEESFPFDETAGQDKAITETIDDLTSEQPMDRLICGDVGYGKTEVAVRAAFKVVEDGFQVAILVPTTVLAEQHAKTFRERMSGFPVTVDCINRFRSSSDQRRIIKDLAAARIDIIIGTHRLLSKDVVFKNLGLLIVDEEHRFGVSHKEKIKQIKAEVDILTLTATPIPRTLEMSLLGIRDLSIISSPPEHRRPVKTFVARYDDLVIKEAVSKEMRRQGQVFFVHNRVKSIHRMAATIQNLVPEARVAVAHGQMDGKELEAIMVAFVNRDIDVLVCTTIIESGLDIPSANTIIINRADSLGLAEIYQLRGRVGRSSTQSYAYLLVPSLDDLSRDSKDRLQALMDCNELGGGFKLAMSDLQIRGGGNLLGVSQSGHIAAIGYELYLDLLQQTVNDLKTRATCAGTLGTSLTEELEPEINLQISAYIPETYIPDVSQRYIAYRRISALTTADSAQHVDLQDELIDRYGTLPAETINLLEVVNLKKEMIALKINKLEKGRDNLVFSFLKTTPIDPALLLQYLQTTRNKNKKSPTPTLTPDGRLLLPTQSTSPPELFSAIYKTLTDLSQLIATPKES